MHKLHLPVLQEATVEVTHPINHAKFTLLKSTYGSLSEDPANPLSAVSVANSSLSIDLWQGCAWQCAYCHVQGSVRNLDEKGVMPKQTSRTTKFSIKDILVALQAHPFFIAHESILSIGTSSTEPLAHGQVEDSTFEVLAELQRQGLRNPVWIVTKSHVSKNRILMVKQFCDSGSTLIFSPTINGLDKTIEPLQSKRIRNWGKVAEAGAKIVLYLRPLVRSWGSTESKISAILEDFRAELGHQTLTAIVPGGLRWTEGIDYGLQVRNLNWPADLAKTYNEKDLDDGLWYHVVAEAKRFFPQVPVVHHSSCALSTALTRSDLSQVFSRSPVACAESTCSSTQREACERAGKELSAHHVELTVAALAQLGLDPDNDSEIAQGTYALRRSLLKALADQVRVKY